MSDHRPVHSGRLILLMMIAAGSVCLTAQDPTPANTGAVSGFVRYAGGAPIADVRVSLIVPGDRSPRTTRTGVDGSYKFEAISPGEYQLSASHAGVVAKRITVTPGSEFRDSDFSIPDGSSRRVVTGRVVMNEASKAQQVPAHIGVGIMRTDGTLVLPLAPGDQRVVVRLPEGYFLDFATYGPTKVYSLDSVGGRRLSSAALAITVPPEPETIPELVVTLGSFRSRK